MNATELQNALQSFLEEVSYMDADDRAEAGVPDELDDIEQVATFEEAGLLTSDAGLVLRAGNGSEFQLTIIQSR